MEFHALILCGSGNKLRPLNSISKRNVEKTTVPKALMPIGDKPAITYTLDWCQKAGFSEITVVSVNESLAEIKSYVDEGYPKDRNQELQQPLIPIEVVGVESQNTKDLLNFFKNKVKRDFVCMACDFITDVEPETLLDHHRNRRKDTIITTIYYRNQIETIDKKSVKADIVIHTSLKFTSPLLLDLYPRDQVEKKSLKLRESMVLKHPNSVVSSNLLQSSINFCSHKLIDVLQTGSSEIHPVSVANKPWTKVIRDIARRSWRHSQPLDNVAIAIIDDSNTFVRISNLTAYMEANRWIMKQKAKNSGSARPTSAAKGAATVGADSFVGANTQLGERTSVKKTVVGNNCIIGKRCRLNGCIILDGAKIEDDVHLESSLVGKDSIINAKCRLTHCTVEGGYEIARETQAKDEKFEGFDLEYDDGDDYSLRDEAIEDSDEDEGSDDSEYDDYQVEEFDDDDGLFDRS